MDIMKTKIKNYYQNLGYIKCKSTKKNMKHKNYIFTLNNYTPEEYKDIVYKLRIKTEYFVIGFEKGEISNIKHLQGVICFKSRTAEYVVNQILKKASIQICKNKFIHIEYCKKKGCWAEFGFLNTKWIKKV